MDTIRTAEYFKVQIPDKPGEGVKVLSVLRNAGVNLLAFSAFPRNRRAQVDFVPADPMAFKNAVKQAKWKVQGLKTCFLAEGDDRVGAVADLIGRLSQAKINVTALDAVTTVHGRYAALFWVKPKDVKKAMMLLGIG
jgi:hypothetical protein